MGRRKGKKAKQRAKAKAGPPQEYKVTLPNGSKRIVTDTKGLPRGTKITWTDNKTGRSSWNVTGGGWPFDD